MLNDPPRRRYDKDEVRKRSAEVVACYLGAGKNEGGTRMVWTCPACRKEEKLALRLEDNLFGCFIDGCELGGKADIITFIAYMESLDQRTDFRKVLGRAYTILGLDGLKHSAASPSGKSRKSTQAQQSRAERQSPSAEEIEERLELCHTVFFRIMELSKLEERDRKYLRRRGLSYEMIKAGRFGSMSHQRAAHVKKVLREEFGEEKLLRVPGFFEDARTRKFGFTLTGDYLLIPYLDNGGRVTNIEGRSTGEVPGGMGRYVSLRNSGNHLYVFPTLAREPGRIEAFTEGSFGAIIAAQSGIVVGSIQGCKRYRAGFSSASPFGAIEPGASKPLHELRDVNFRNRRIPYIPDADDPPKEDVLKAAPEAACHLIERQGGHAALCSLPRGLDLDEWLLSIPADERRRAFAELLAGAVPLERAEEWKQSRRRPKKPKRQSKRGRGSGTPRIGTVQREGSTDGRDAPGAPEVNTEEDRGETIGIPPADPESEGGPYRDAVQEGAPRPSSAADEPDGDEKPDGGRLLRHEVYAALLEKASLKDEHEASLMELGVVEEAVEAGMLGSLDAGSSGRVVAELKKRFGAKRLLSVPGFERSGSGEPSIGLPLRGEHLLLPCLDGDALITAIEAIAYDPERGGIPDPNRTVPLSGAGAHLYVFAPYSPTEIEGFCEGPIAAVLAAQNDVVLGAIGHYRRYTADGGSSDNREQVGALLPELKGVDFEGREVCYVPALGPGEENARAREAGSAGQHLIGRRNGLPKLVFTAAPGHQSSPGKDDAAIEEKARPPRSLLEYILATSDGDRQELLQYMFAQNSNRVGSKHPAEGKDCPEEGGGEDSGRWFLKPPSLTEMGFIAAGTLVVAVVCRLLLVELEAFGHYVGLTPDGQPLMEGGMLGTLRSLASSEPFEALYSRSTSLSWLFGFLTVLAGLLCYRIRMDRSRRFDGLSRFREGPWRAHLVSEGERERRMPSRSPVLPREVVEAGIASAMVYAAGSILVGWLGTLGGALGSVGAEVGELASVAQNSGRLVLYGAVGVGLLVLWRRVSMRLQRVRIVEGKV